MLSKKEVDLPDKIIISFAILTAIVTTFKRGFGVGAINFIYILTLCYTARVLWNWIVSDNKK